MMKFLILFRRLTLICGGSAPGASSKFSGVMVLPLSRVLGGPENVPPTWPTCTRTRTRIVLSRQSSALLAMRLALLLVCKL